MKDKEIIFKTTNGKRVIIYRGTHIRLKADLSTETFQANREWDNTLKILKEKTVNEEHYTQWSCPSEIKEG